MKQKEEKNAILTGDKKKIRPDKIADKLVEETIANKEWHSPDANPRSWHHQENLESVIFGLMLCKGVRSVGLPGLSKNQAQSLNQVCKMLAGFVLQDPNHSMSAERSPFLGENETATRKAGKVLHDIDGVSLMEQVIEMIVPPCDRREIECIWHGIGEWKA